MAVSIRSQSGKSYLAGLTWVDADPGGPLPGAVPRGARGVDLERDGRRSVGYINPAEWDEDYAGSGSLAAALASSIQDGIVVLPLRPTRWLVCTVQGGVVVAGGERMSSPDEVPGLLKADPLLVTGALRLHCPAGAEMDQRLGPFSPVRLPVLPEILESLPDDKSFLVRRLSASKVGRRELLAAAAVLGVAAVGIGLWIAHSHRKIVAPVGINAEQQKAQMEAAWRKDLARALDGAAANTDPAWVSAVYGRIASMPLAVSGYRLKTASCTPDGVCEMHYAAGERALLRGFDAVMAPLASTPITYPLDGKSASLKMKFPVPPAPHHGDGWYRGIPDTRVAVIDLVQLIQQIQQDWYPGGITIDANEPTPLSGVGADPATGATYYTGKMTWRIAQLWELKPLLARVFAANPYLSINKLTVRADPSSAGVDLEATYVVR